jgi:glycosyltransferase involved in cell wall biosynthesis
MFGWLKRAAAAARSRLSLVVVVTRNGAHALARAHAVNQIQIWDETSQRWKKRIDRAAWRGQVASWVRRAGRPVADVVYAVATPAVTGLARPRIIHIMPNVYVGGSTQLVVDLHNHLGHRYEMEVITSALPKSGRLCGMAIHRVAWSIDPQQVADLLRACKPDLVHVHYWGSTDTPWYDAIFAGVGANSQMVLQNVNTPVVPYDHPGVVMNVFVSNAVRALDGRAVTPARVIHPGIDLRHFARRPFADYAETSIGMVYRLEPDKLSLQSIESFIAVAQRRPQARAFIIGDGTLFAPFVARAKAAGVFANVVFTGAVPYAELPAWYARFKLFVAPVWQESFGQVAPFAMAMGLAVAGNRVGALPEILGDEDTLGVDLDDTVDRIVALLDDPLRLMHLGQLNCARANRLFGVQAMSDRYSEVYAGLLSRATGAAHMERSG